ncbi:hypothetical protein ISF_04239 [Cordyceps fumosorosea ARSEF 2679]|uniref:DUF1750-domain-containing protein n=1 Tax=Cordyceps fumosorosea (strain ARSEF 2679) TaxID=1081104 RepID=A0A167XD57_CORFA|nr:hypothetical protein ISF_04239 [Cordyceps fumosorosea ARSEF 2679]OAA64829.1 hypothetical protein ISF_04239 [Cordyceps fumosorosea ARSEF 2679]
MAQQPDPSHNVPGELIPHIHLTSSFRYPAAPRLDINEVGKWLLAAPQVARDKAAFFWGYLDKPADGTTLLTWQPLQRLGTNFATDGFVWAPPEEIYKHDLRNGAIMEIYLLKAGYVPGEQVAAHARRRFRLVPMPGHPNPPPMDQNLFIVHYGPSDPDSRLPINAIPYDERVAAIMQQRAFLLSRGMLRRKDFMLSDRANWPTMPELTHPQMAGQQNPRGVPQRMAYPPQPVAGPPAKRARHGQGQQAAMPQMPTIDVMDDDEDISRGDMFDHLTPRELSLGRYQQNHEWMEEILSSPYRMGQITPADLGLGLKGELSALTEGIFASQGGDAFSQLPQKTYVGKLEPGLADEFRTRVNEYIASTETDIAKMKKEQEQKLAKLKEGSFIRTKERELKSLVEQTGPEAWRIEGRVDSTDNDDDHPRSTSKHTLEEIVQQVESSLARKIERKAPISRIQEGGYQLPPPEPEPAAQAGAAAVAGQQMSRQVSQAGSQNSGLMMGDADMDMGDTAAGLLDQMHTGMSSASTPANNFPTPQAHLSAGQSTAATPANANVPSPAPPQPAPPADAAMGQADAPRPEQGNAPGEQDDDWVVVPKDSTSDPSLGIASAAKPVTEEAKAPNVTKPSAEGTPAGSNSYDQNDFSSLGDLDTAGDALSGFDAPELDGGAGLDEDMDLNMDMEDSAFGDAFHGVGATGTPGGEGQE